MPERLDRNIAYDRLTIPTDHLGILLEPAGDRLADLAGGDYSAALDTVRILDTTIGELRRQLRARLELTGPVILTGHQLEFTHAGIFAKSVAADALARQLGTAGVFLVVDSDLPKQTSLWLPIVEGDLVHRVSVPLPGCDPTLPVESQPLVSASRWQRFFVQLAEHADNDSLPMLRQRSTGGWVAHGFSRGGHESANDSRPPPLKRWATQSTRLHHISIGGAIACFAGELKNTPETNLATIIENGHAAVGRQLGLGDFHTLRASWLSQTPEFRAFAAHLILNAREFARHYNKAQREYRIRRRVRNPQRPAPPLFCDADRTELPFWIGRIGQARQRLFVSDNSDGIELYADRESIGTFDKTRLGGIKNHDRPWQVELDGWHLRPRALTLSAFVRLFISDLFIHGIGGAKYDEMTEDFIRSFFKTELPPACCVSATAYLSLPSHGIERQALTQARHARRDLRFNPQRHLDNLPRDLLTRRAELIKTSSDLRSRSRSAGSRRRRVFNEIRAINSDLIALGGEQLEMIEQRARRLSRLYESDRTASDREYFFALHSRETLTKLVQIIQAKLEQPANS